MGHSLPNFDCIFLLVDRNTLAAHRLIAVLRTIDGSKVFLLITYVSCLARKVSIRDGIEPRLPLSGRALNLSALDGSSLRLSRCHI